MRGCGRGGRLRGCSSQDLLAAGCAVEVVEVPAHVERRMDDLVWCTQNAEMGALAVEQTGCRQPTHRSSFDRNRTDYDAWRVTSRVRAFWRGATGSDDPPRREDPP